MGIGSNIVVEEAEQEHEEALFEETLNEATKLVINGVERHQAFAMAKELVCNQQEALSKGDEILIPEGMHISKEQKTQFYAIRRALKEQFS